MRTLSLGQGSVLAFFRGCTGVAEPHTGTRLALAAVTVCVLTSKALTGLLWRENLSLAILSLDVPKFLSIMIGQFLG